MKQEIIAFDGVSYSYSASSEDNKQNKSFVLQNITVSFKKGEFVVVLGKNGSGKTTFGRLINALLIPQKGCIYVDGLSTSNEENLLNIRKKVGVVFQNPDDQLVASIVEQDVAFGLENLGELNISIAVNKALEFVGISDLKESLVESLSGGQKQKVAIAGVLAMQPECIVLDEAATMLDPESKKDILEVIKDLNKRLSITIIYITHDVDDVVFADRVIVLDKGEIALDGTLKHLYSDMQRIKQLGVSTPQVTQLFYELYKENYLQRYDVFDTEQALEVLREMVIS